MQFQNTPGKLAISKKKHFKFNTFLTYGYCKTF